MKREIKFRGKRIDNGDWMYGYLDYRPAMGGFIIHEVGEIPPSYSDPCGDIYSKYFEVDPETVGQFTGLKDKNSKEIYDGDVFRPFSEGIYYYIVIFENGSFKVQSNLGTWGTLERFFEISPKYSLEVEVIGNIYENPELVNARP